MKEVNVLRDTRKFVTLSVALAMAVGVQASSANASRSAEKISQRASEIVGADVPAATEVLSTDAGWSHACEVRLNSKVFCIGDNDRGQLGDGTVGAPRETWARVTKGYLKGKTSIAVGGGFHHSCAITAARRLACWGANQDGQLGDGTRTDRNVPRLIDGGYLAGKRIRSVDGNATHSCAVTMAGKLSCWGSNARGELGDGSTDPSRRPKLIGGGFLVGQEVVAVATGRNHTCALTSTGKVACWGDNSYGQLGDGSRIDRLEPSLIGGRFLAGKTVVAISAGRDHSCALTAGGKLACWGENSSGQLGDGTITTRSVPRQIAGGFLAGKQIKMVSAGWAHTCAITTTGELSCWGDNSSGQLGDGTTVGRRSPVASSADGATVTNVASGSTFTSVVTDSENLIHGTFEYEPE